MAGRIESSRKHGPFDPRFPKTRKAPAAEAATETIGLGSSLEPTAIHPEHIESPTTTPHLWQSGARR
jgi:hypothetical protein